MPERSLPEPSPALDPDEQEGIRALNRTPHPYHHHSAELQLRSARDGLGSESPAAHNGDALSSPTTRPAFAKESSPASDSGTDADDEHFLKGLPAPRVRLHKGLRGRNEFPSGISTPLASPAIPGDEQSHAAEKDLSERQNSLKRRLRDAERRRKVLVRRVAEISLVLALGGMVCLNPLAYPLVRAWNKDFQRLGLLLATLLALYPLRVAAWAHRHRRPSRMIPFKIPSNVDPAPLLYPPTLTIFASLLVSPRNPMAVLPNVILSICSIPPFLIPQTGLATASNDPLHWALSVLPLNFRSTATATLGLTDMGLSDETLVLLYPLHRTLCSVLQLLTTTSLLEAELQLLSIALIDLFILAVSPQVQVLKALLWVGGLCTLVLCGPVIKWGIALARVPKWRFRRTRGSSKSHFWKDLRRMLSGRRTKHQMLASTTDDSLDDTDSSANDDDQLSMIGSLSRARTLGPNHELRCP
ncbi:hypothetical protein CDD83_175 [Cordyceps sp. RAO-2017]|nr:hypothetical protein CDD83_175 [Cordyceps sp. RAO-2017]